MREGKEAAGRNLLLPDMLWFASLNMFRSLTRGGCAGVSPGADVTCFGDYITVPDDPSFRTSAGHGNYRCDAFHGARGWRVAGGGPFHLGYGHHTDLAWYRLPAGRGLAAAPPGEGHCGTGATGWVTGWPAGADQDSGGGGSEFGWRRPGTDGPDDAGQPGYNYRI